MCLYSDIDECEEGMSDRCDLNSACNNTAGSYTCSCNYGYSGDGSICIGKSITEQLGKKFSMVHDPMCWV